MAAITASQMRKIHVSARERGMDNDLLHIHVRTLTGKESLRELTVSEAVRVIDSLEGKSHKPGDHASAKQMRYIEALAKELGWQKEDGSLDKDRLNGFLSKRYGLDHYRWLTRSTASKVIEGLKHMLESRAGRKEPD